MIPYIPMHMQRNVFLFTSTTLGFFGHNKIGPPPARRRPCRALAASVEFREERLVDRADLRPLAARRQAAIPAAVVAEDGLRFAPSAKP